MNHAQYFRSLVIVAMLLSAGCATLTAEQCRGVDWLVLGVADGAAGRASWYADRHAASCRDHGIAMDMERYRAGREQGLRQFCTPENGCQWGREGKDFTRVCPADLAQAFENAYDRGRVAYAFEQEEKWLEQWMMRGIFREQLWMRGLE